MSRKNIIKLFLITLITLLICCCVSANDTIDNVSIGSLNTTHESIINKTLTENSNNVIKTNNSNTNKVNDTLKNMNKSINSSKLSVTSLSGTLSGNYELTGKVTITSQVDANNAVVDAKGNTITCSGSKGGFYVKSGKLTIKNAVITGSTSKNFVKTDSSGAVTLINCTFHDNSFGEAILYEYGGKGINITNCTFYDNTLTSDSYSALIYTRKSGSSVIINNTVFNGSKPSKYWVYAYDGKIYSYGSYVNGVLWSTKSSSNGNYFVEKSGTITFDNSQVVTKTATKFVANITKARLINVDGNLDLHLTTTSGVAISGATVLYNCTKPDGTLTGDKTYTLTTNIDGYLSEGTSVKAGYVPQMAGTFKVYAYYAGSSEYESCTFEDTFVVYKGATSINVNDMTQGTVGVSQTISATVTTPNGGTVNDSNVTFYADGTKIGSSKVTNNVSSIDYAPTSTSTIITAKYSGSSNYNDSALSSSKTLSATSPLTETAITFNPSISKPIVNQTISVRLRLAEDDGTAIIGETVYLKVTSPNGTVIVNNESVTTRSPLGIFNNPTNLTLTSFTPQIAGNYHFQAYYSGSTTYSSCSYDNYLTISKANVSKGLEADDGTIGVSQVISATINTTYGSVNEGYIRFKDSNGWYNDVNVTNGVASTTYTPTTTTTNVWIEYYDENGNFNENITNTTTSLLTIISSENKQVSITVSDLYTVVNVTKQINITVCDVRTGSSITSGISVSIDGVTQDVTYQNNNATIKYTPTTSGIKTLNISFSASGYVDNSYNDTFNVYTDFEDLVTVINLVETSSNLATIKTNASNYGEVTTYNGQTAYRITLNGNNYLSNVTSTISRVILKNSTLYKALIINGNNKVIDANTWPLFSITSNSTVIIENLTLKNTNHSYLPVIFCQSKSTLIIKNCTFENNYCSYGSAIYNAGTSNISYSTFRNNVAKYGIIYSEDEGILIIDHNLFENNHVNTSDGYVIYDESSNYQINTNNIYINNTDNTRDMLFFKYAGDITVYGNTYVDNYLNDTITLNNNSVDALSGMLDLSLNLNSRYNDTIRNGSIILYIDGVAYTGFDASENIIIPETITTGTHQLKIDYISESKHYQNMTYPDSGTVQINLVARDVNVTVDEVNSIIFNTTTLTAHITNHESTVNHGIVKFIYNDVIIGIANVSDNTASINAVFNETINNGLLKVNYTDNTTYNNNSASNRININKRSSILYVNNTFSGVYGSIINIEVVVKDVITNETVTDGVVNFKINDITYPVEIVDGSAIYNYTINTLDDMTITSWYNGNTNYNASSNEDIIISTTSEPTNITITSVTAKVSETIEINATISSTSTVNTGIVVFTYSNGTIIASSNVVDNKASITKVFNHVITDTIKATFTDESGLYVSSTTNAPLTITKASATIEMELPTDITIGETLTINITIKNGDDNVTDGVLTVLIDDVEQEITIDENSTSHVTYTPTSTGNKTITVKFTSANYDVEDKTIILSVNKIKTSISMSDFNITVFDDNILNVTLTNLNNSNINAGYVEFRFNNGTLIGTSSITDNKTVFSVKFSNTYNGIINATYVDDTNVFETSTTHSILTINKANAYLTIDTTGSIFINETSIINITVKDKSNVNINDGVLSILIDDVEQDYEYYEDSLIAKTTYSSETSGNKTIKVTFTSDNYNAEEETSTLPINPIKTEITAYKLTGVVSEELIFTVNVTSNVSTVNTGYVVFGYSSGITVDQSNVINGQATFTVKFDKVLNETMLVVYSDDDKYYEPSTTSFKLLINKASAEIEVNTTDSIFINESIIINMTILHGETVVNDGILTVLVDDVEQVISTDEETGISSITYTPRVTGNKTIKIVFASDNYDVEDKILNLEVKKLPTGLELSSITAKVDEKIQINATLSDNSINIGKVIFSYSNSTIIGVASVTGGVASLDVTFNNTQTDTITVTYADDTNYYETSSNTAELEITQAIAIINVELPNNATINQTSLINITIKNGEKTVTDGVLKVLIDEVEQTITLNDDNTYTITFTPLTSGNKMINITFTSDNYLVDDKNTTFNVDKINTVINVGDISSKVADTVLIEVLVKTVDESDVDTGMVIFIYNNTIIDSKEVTGGFASITVVFNNTINDKIYVQYIDEDNYFNSSENSSNLVITKASADIIINTPEGITIDEETSILFTIKNGDNIVNDGVIEVFIDTIKQTVILEDNGSYILTFTPATSGNKTLNVSFNSDNYDVDNKTLNFSVSKVSTMFSLSNITGNVDDEVELIATFEEDENVNNGIVTFIYNGVTLGSATVHEGVASLKVVFNNTITDVYKAEYSDEDGYFEKSTSTANIIINQATAVMYITIPDKITVNTTTIINVTVKNGEKTVTDGEFKALINNVEQNITVDEYGVAHVSIIPTNTNSATITIKFLSDNYIVEDKIIELSYNKIEVDISIDDVTATVNKQVTLIATLNSDVNINLGYVEFTYSNGVTIARSNVTNNIASVNYTFKNALDDTILVKYVDEDNYFNTTNNSAKLIVNKANGVITINTIGSIFINETTIINVTVVDDNGENITDGVLSVLIDDTTYNISYDESIANIIYSSRTSGNKTIQAVFISDNYDVKTETSIILINPIKTELTLNNIEGVVSEEITFKVNVTSNVSVVNTGYVVFGYSNGTPIGQSNVTNGTATISAKYTNVLKDTIVVVYSDDDKYYETASSSTKLTINKALANISVDIPDSILINETLTIIVKILNDETLINDGTLSISINNNTQEVIYDESMGTFSAIYTPDSTGNKSINISFNSDNYNVNDKIINLTVNKIANTLTLSNINAKVAEEVIINATLTSDDTINKGYVVFKYSNDTIIALSNVSEGIASIKVVFNNTIKDTIKAEYIDESDYYESSENTANLTITTAQATINVEIPETIKVNESIILNITVKNDDKLVLDGTLNVSIDNIEQEVVFDENNVAQVLYTPNTSGNKTLIIKFNSSNYDVEDKNIILSVDKFNTILSLNNPDTTVGVQTSIIATITSENTKNVNEGKIEFFVNNTSIGVVDVKDNTASINYTPQSLEENITVIYTGSDYYNNDSITTTYTSAKGNINIIIDAEDVLVNATGTIKIQILNNITNTSVNEGGVLVYVNNNLQETNFTNGTVIFNYSSEVSQNVNIKVNYVGVNYDDNENTTSFNVNKLATITSVNDISVIVGVDGSITVNVETQGSTKINSGVVTVYINGIEYNTASVVDGIATLVYTPEHTATVTITAKYSGDSNHYNPSEDLNGKLFSISKSKTNIQVTNSSENIVGSPINITVTVKDESNNIITGGYVRFTIDDVITDVLINTTTKNAYYNYTPLVDGELIITIQYIGSDDYNPSTTELLKFNITQLHGHINLEEIPYYVINQEKTIKFNITDDNKDLIDARDVTVTIDGQNQEVISSSNMMIINYKPTTSGTKTLEISYNNAIYKTESITSTFRVYTDYEDLLNLINLIKTGINLNDVANSGTNKLTFIDDNTAMITLEGENYTSNTTSITINENANINALIINGNSKTIDANNTQLIIIDDNYSLTLNNITLTNGMADNGGLIYNNGNLTINNSVLTNSSAVSTKLSSKLSSSQFEENSGNGGLIYHNNGKLIISNTKLSNSTADNYGGAIYEAKGTITINNATIIYNNASYGGAIFSNSDATIENSNLSNNNVKYSGGTILSNTVLTLINNTIADNVGENGAVITSYGILNIINNRITNNAGKTNNTNSSVIYIEGLETQITGNILTNNTANNNVIHIKTGIVTLENNTLDHNYVNNQTGYVIFNEDKLTIKNNTFNNNTDDTRDMLLESNENAELIIENNILTDNYLSDTLELETDNITTKNKTLNISISLNRIYNDSVRDGTLQVYIDDELYDEYTVKNNTLCEDITLDRLSNGTYKLDLKLVSNSYDYQTSTLSKTLTINIISTSLSSAIINNMAGNATIQVNITANVPVEQGIVIIKNNGSVVGQANVENGSVTIKTSIDKAGEYSFDISYVDEESVYDSSDDQSLNNIVIVARIASFDIKLNNNTWANDSINITLTDYTTNELIKDAVIEIYLNNTLIKQNTTNNDAIAVFNLNLPVGEHNLLIKYETEEYNSNTTYLIEIIKRNVIINAGYLNNLAGNVTLNITVKDAITNESITTGYLNITDENNTNYGRVKLNSTGNTELLTTINKFGLYDLIISYEESENYLNTSIQLNNFEVKNRDILLEFELLNDTIGNVTYNISLKDLSTNQSISKQYITIESKTSDVITAYIDDEYLIIKMNTTLPEDRTLPYLDTLDITYGDNLLYPIKTDRKELTIQKIVTNISAEVLNNTADGVKIKVTVQSDLETVDDGVITLSDGKIVGIGSITNGTVTINTNITTKGLHNISIDYLGVPERYTSSSDSEILKNLLIVGKKSTMDYEVINNTVGNITLKINLSDEESNETLIGETVYITSLNGSILGTGVIDEENASVIIKTSINQTDLTSFIIKYGGNTKYNGTNITINNFNMDKIYTKVSSTILNTTANNVIINITVNSDLEEVISGTVQIINNKNNANVGEGNISHGYVTIKTNINETGSYDLRIDYLGNNRYYLSTNNNSLKEISIQTRDTNIAYTILNNTIGNVTINITLTDTSLKTLLNNKEVTVKDSLNNTIATGVITNNALITKLSINKTGQNSINIIFAGDKTYTKSNLTSTVDVTKIITKTTAEIKNKTASNLTISINVTTDLERVTNGSVNVFDGTNLVGTGRINNGILTITTNITRKGSYNLTINYEGEYRYQNSSTTLENIQVLGRNVTIKTEILNNTVENTTIKITVNDTTTNRNVSNATVLVVTSNGTIIGNGTLVNGTVNITLNNNATGNQNISIIFDGNDEYNQSTINLTFNVSKHNSTFNISKINTVAVGRNVSITGVLRNELKPITNATLKLIINGKNIKNITTNANGRYNYTYTTNIVGLNNVSVIYDGDNINIKSEINTTFNTTKRAVKIELVPFNGTIDENSTLIAKVTDELGYNVTNGSISFKINGKTLRNDGRFDTSSPVLLIKVTNGVAKYTLVMESYLRYSTNFSAVYTGANIYEANRTTDAPIINMSLRQSAVTVKVTPTAVKQNKNLTITVTIRDITNGKNKVPVNSEKAVVIFKLNGLTLKDANGSTIKVNVVNGVAKYVYHIPQGMFGVDVNEVIFNHNITAIYYNPIYVSGTRNSTTFIIERSNITMNVNVTYNKTSQKLTLKGNFTDYNKDLVVGTTVAIIKVSGLTLRDSNNKTVQIYIDNGILKETNITLSGIYINPNIIALVTSPRYAYYKTTVEFKVRTVN